MRSIDLFKLLYHTWRAKISSWMTSGETRQRHKKIYQHLKDSIRSIDFRYKNVLFIPSEYRKNSNEPVFFKDKTTLEVQHDYHNIGLSDNSSFQKTEKPETVYIIIPVYNGLDFLEKLLPSLFKNTSLPHQFVFVDDCSPDKRVVEYLEHALDKRDDCTLIKNKTNSGFVKTVNMAAGLTKGNDFVLLNTDTEVPENWLERLMAPLYANDDVASVTPFSNCATIYSFPAVSDDSDADNSLFLKKVGLERINRHLSRLDTSCYLKDELSAPTGVGFCMAVSGKAWQDVGKLNEDLFEKGYGEEVDWCQRAIQKGWKNLLCPNLFVAHHHGGSFPSDEKSRYIEHHGKIISEHYPNYNSDVSLHLESDPWRGIKNQLFILLALEKENHPVLYVTHFFGGGATLYLEKEINKRLKNGLSSFVLNYDFNEQKYILTIYYKTHIYSINNFDRQFLNTPSFKNIEKIIINELVKHPAADCCRETTGYLISLKKHYDCAMDILFHDFYAICPRVNLLTKNFKYCRLNKSEQFCNYCGDYICANFRITEWRSNFSQLIHEANSIIFFSDNTYQTVSKVLNIEPEKVKVIPHEITLKKYPAYPVNKDVINIGIVGYIGIHKGSEIVFELSNILKTRLPKARIIVIGIYDGEWNDNIYETGEYNNEFLYEILQDLKINLCFFSSICPETFSFVTSELINVGLPVVCFPVGAQADRIGKYQHGFIADEISAQDAYETISRVLKQYGIKH